MKQTSSDLSYVVGYSLQWFTATIELSCNRISWCEHCSSIKRLEHMLVSRTKLSRWCNHKNVTPLECRPCMRERNYRVHTGTYLLPARTRYRMYDTCCLFTRRRCLLLRRLFLFTRRYHLISHAAQRETALSFSFAFIKYKQFHTFRPTPERPAGCIFTTRHSGFCQLSSVPASCHFADSSL